MAEADVGGSGAIAQQQQQQTTTTTRTDAEIAAQQRQEQQAQEVVAAQAPLTKVVSGASPNQYGQITENHAPWMQGYYQGTEWVQNVDYDPNFFQTHGPTIFSGALYTDPNSFVEIAPAYQQGTYNEHKVEVGNPFFQESARAAINAQFTPQYVNIAGQQVEVRQEGMIPIPYKVYWVGTGTEIVGSAGQSLSFTSGTNVVTSWSKDNGYDSAAKIAEAVARTGGSIDPGVAADARAQGFGGVTIGSKGQEQIVKFDANGNPVFINKATGVPVFGGTPVSFGDVVNNTPVAGSGGASFTGEIATIANIGTIGNERSYQQQIMKDFNQVISPRVMYDQPIGPQQPATGSGQSPINANGLNTYTTPSGMTLVGKALIDSRTGEYGIYTPSLDINKFDPATGQYGYRDTMGLQASGGRNALQSGEVFVGEGAAKTSMSVFAASQAASKREAPGMTLPWEIPREAKGNVFSPTIAPNVEGAEIAPGVFTNGEITFVGKAFQDPGMVPGTLNVSETTTKDMSLSPNLATTIAFVPDVALLRGAVGIVAPSEAATDRPNAINAWEQFRLNLSGNIGNFITMGYGGMKTDYGFEKKTTTETFETSKENVSRSSTQTEQNVAQYVDSWVASKYGASQETKVAIENETGIKGLALNLGLGAFEGITEHPTDVAKFASGGYLFAAGAGVIGGAATAATAGSKVGSAAVSVSGNVLGYGMLGVYGLSVGERSTAGFTEFGGSATRRFGEIATSEAGPLFGGGIAYGRANAAPREAPPAPPETGGKLSTFDRLLLMSAVVGEGGTQRGYGKSAPKTVEEALTIVMPEAIKGAETGPQIRQPGQSLAERYAAGTEQSTRVYYNKIDVGTGDLGTIKPSSGPAAEIIQFDEFGRLRATGQAGPSFAEQLTTQKFIEGSRTSIYDQSTSVKTETMRSAQDIQFEQAYAKMVENQNIASQMGDLPGTGNLGGFTRTTPATRPFDASVSLLDAQSLGLPEGFGRPIDTAPPTPKSVEFGQMRGASQELVNPEIVAATRIRGTTVVDAEIQGLLDYAKYSKAAKEQQVLDILGTADLTPKAQSTVNIDQIWADVEAATREPAVRKVGTQQEVYKPTEEIKPTSYTEQPVSKTTAGAAEGITFSGNFPEFFQSMEAKTLRGPSQDTFSGWTPADYDASGALKASSVDSMIKSATASISANVAGDTTSTDTSTEQKTDSLAATTSLLAGLSIGTLAGATTTSSTTSTTTKTFDTMFKQQDFGKTETGVGPFVKPRIPIIAFPGWSSPSGPNERTRKRIGGKKFTEVFVMDTKSTVGTGMPAAARVMKATAGMFGMPGPARAEPVFGSRPPRSEKTSRRSPGPSLTQAMGMQDFFSAPKKKAARRKKK